jgi:parallel beta-helix repeat protein
MSVLRLSDCHRFRVLGLSIQDTDRAQTYDGILVSRSSAGVIDGVQIRDVKWAGIGVFDATPQTSRDITITNCVVEGTRFGISVNGADIRVTNNHVAMYWPSTAEAAAKGGVWSAPSDYYDGIMVLQGADRIVVAGNTVIECGQSGIYINACTNLVVTGNMVSGCQLRGIELDGGAGTAVGASIVANTVTGCVCQINLVRARDITVVGNRLLNPNPALANTCLGVNVGTTNVVVVGNHLDQSNPNSPAVWVDPGATEVTIAWNEVKAATPYQAPPGVAIAYRGAAGHLTTSGRLIASGGIGVGNRLPASTLGPVSGKIEVFSATGASLGWVPVYQSIS